MFYSRNPQYRDPVGAVEAGTSIHFRITVARDQRCSGARLVVTADTGGSQTLGLFWCGMNGDAYEWWECHYTAPAAGLYFYEFYVDTWHGCLRLGRGFNGADVIDPKAPRWQLTVYEKGFTTPDWLAGGVMYQNSSRTASAPPAARSSLCRQTARCAGTGAASHGGSRTRRARSRTPTISAAICAASSRSCRISKSLGVTCLYLNPIFEAHSNHRYNTANYARIDPLLGTEEDFRVALRRARRSSASASCSTACSATRAATASISTARAAIPPWAHTSRRIRRITAWYSFRKWPDDYESWWGFVTLPNVNETNESYNEYINGESGIVPSWLRAGASGWRLDVADELPDAFLDNLRAAAKRQDPQAIAPGRGVGGRLHEIRLRPAPPLPAGPPASTA